MKEGMNAGGTRSMKIWTAGLIGAVYLLQQGDLRLLLLIMTNQGLKKENIIKIDEAMASYKWLDSIKIDDMSHEEFDEIPDSEKEKVQSYSVEEVKQLADMQLDSDISDSDKKKINKQPLVCPQVSHRGTVN